MVGEDPIIQMLDKADPLVNTINIGFFFFSLLWDLCLPGTQNGKLYRFVCHTCHLVIPCLLMDYPAFISSHSASRGHLTILQHLHQWTDDAALLNSVVNLDLICFS